MTTDPSTPDPVAARLAGIRLAHLDRASKVAPYVPALLAALEAVLAAHRRAVFNVTSGEHRGKPYCLDCTTSIDHQTAYALWPCKTYRAISTALLGETGQSLGEQPHPAAHCHLGGKPHLGPCTDPEAGTDG
jgi:hypothetical protein